MCYTEIIEDVEEQLKEMEEKPEKFHSEIAVRMQDSIAVCSESC